MCSSIDTEFESLNTAPGANVIRIFTTGTYKFLKQAKAFVPAKPFQPSLMIVGEARSLP